MKNRFNPLWLPTILVGFLALFLMVTPLSIEIKTNTSTAQEGQLVEYTLRTIIGQTPPFAYIGVGGDIDGVINPDLTANVGDTVRITLINGDPVLHDLKIDEFNVFTGELVQAEQSATVEFVADQPGNFEYYCTVPGHREVGMKGLLRIVGTVTVGDAGAMEEALADTGYGASGSTAMDHSSMAAATVAPAAEDAVSIIRNPADLPAPLNNSGAPQHHVVELTTIEVNGQLDDGATFRYMTFDGQVPGPMLRMTVGDTMEVRVRNEIESLLPHSIDLHAVTGPGGGAEFTQTFAGEVSVFNFRALQPGLYVYHCATASIAHHISSGMYGLILVEPEGGLPQVDREFYVMQGELYTVEPFGTKGMMEMDYDKLLSERPEYFFFNGSVGALTRSHPLYANAGETVRIFFGVGGPNFTSSFHVIGEIFDHVYSMGSVMSPPVAGVQTVTVPPGGATIVDFKIDRGGHYVLVDHALSRAERGLVGYLIVDGPENDDIMHAGPAQDGAE